MKKAFKKSLSLFMAFVFTMSACVIGFSADTEDYKIISPYEDVIWEGENAWGAYKGNLHTHSTVSDAEEDMRDMIIEYYNQGFDFLCMTEHGITGKAWNEDPTELPLYLYQKIIGNAPHNLTDEEFAAITSGSYPVDGEARGTGMVCLTGGNELNGVTMTKCHVNGLFLPEGVGDNNWGFENNHEYAVKLADEAGGISFINHPGDWLNSKYDRETVSDPKNVKYFGDIIMKYDSCYGMEVFNESNSVTRYDRILWDNILMYCLPYGKTVIGFANGDTHKLVNVNTSFSIYMMEDNTVENIKETMKSGSSFMVTRVLPADPDLGPEEEFNKKREFNPYPTFSNIAVDGHKITVSVKDCYNIQWVGNGKVIASQDINQSSETTVYTLDLDSIENAENLLYVRCQLLGSDGCTLTQAFPIDNGTEKKVFEEDTSLKAKIENFFFRLFSLRFFVLFSVLATKIKNKLA